MNDRRLQHQEARPLRRTKEHDKRQAQPLHRLYPAPLYLEKTKRPIPAATAMPAATTPNFRGFVDFLCAESNRVCPPQMYLCRDFFCRAVSLELSFFEVSYTGGVLLRIGAGGIGYLTSRGAG
jgi:hypothetical protein